MDVGCFVSTGALAKRARGRSPSVDRSGFLAGRSAVPVVSNRARCVRMVVAPIPTDSTGTSSDVQLDRVICKFGGSSLADSTRLREVTKIVKMQTELTRKFPVVVLSAMGPSTNELLRAGERALTEGVVDISSVRSRAYEACDSFGLKKEELVDPLLTNLDQLLLGIKFLRELTPRGKDYLVSFGERLSVRIMAAHLAKNENLPAKAFDAFDVGFLTDSNFLNAEIQPESLDRIASFFDELGPNTVAIVTGFIGKDVNGEITTLGRGGSDLTATTIGAAINASEVQVWKDVDGILSTDPRVVEKAIPVPSVTYTEAAEMAYFGAKVLHPVAMMPAMKNRITVRVKNSYNPTHPGTKILPERKLSDDAPVTAISVKRNVQLVDIVSTRMLGAYGFLAEVFKIFAQHQVSVDMIATSEVSISLTLDSVACSESTVCTLKTDLETIANTSFQNGKSIVSLVSNQTKSSMILGKAANALAENGIQIQMVSQGAAKFNIGFVLDNEEANKAVEVLHDVFFGR
uniref:Aspartokinase n=1 Tax=Rhodosorus marinus TaxID=101924 RepID=A0A7S3EG08_9RHOD|mmetsp:Transcript_33097/g.130097  ORF Transcript_33097/g.130097 Transcript_33097/m.130097 type:complete len:517 (+) Transcript_33097:131-1681(+)|eukprot:CAMPEP_0113967642 /NCGR_PEP_ID=MMETSP0011_2-20120614/9058_1 /TAXON_ID=101924 /ORGANISM="Rhodosorus marinus" /LENGTH=516 /DNA_ID=CAMNT_0000980577 /DNA_START=247 /DNA_END=1797 /DNA_ORIENTATION=+ /assembly_acc=CAM_ASM_000156